MLDSRLKLVFSMYKKCETGADIGTDHGLLPCTLIMQGVCQRMVLTDISKKALSHAMENIRKFGIDDKCRCVCADGLQGLDEVCGCISITGMGGETISRIISRDREKISGAALLLSPQTDIHLVRRAVVDISYHVAEERVCFDNGRYYIVLKAERGSERMTPAEIRHGKSQWADDMNVLAGYLNRRKEILKKQLQGLEKAENIDDELYNQVMEDIAYYDESLEGLKESKIC